MPIIINDELMSSNSTEVIGRLSSAHFGAIGVNNFGFNYFVEHTDEIGLTDIRFPGGTVSEEGYVVDGRIRLGMDEVNLQALSGDRTNIAFDLTHPELISPAALQYDEENHLLRDDVATFSQALDLAVKRGVNFALIIPVERYFTGADLSDPAIRELATETARQDVSAFLERLKAGSFNNGVLPEKIMFDIGNEAYANPIEYALIAEVMISEISEQLGETDIQFEINYQMGRGSYEFNNLLEAGYFDSFFSESGSALPELNDLAYLVNDSLTYAERQVAIDKMMINILGDAVQYIDGVRHHVLSYNSNKLTDPEAALYQRQHIVDFWLDTLASHEIDPNEINYYVSAWTTSTHDAGGLPYELAGAANTLELFAYFMDMGVDSAAAWGITSEFRYRDSMSSTTVTDRLSEFLSPQAAILQLLSQNVMNADFLGAEGDFSLGQMRYYYETEDAFTVFLTVGDLDEGNIQFQFDLGIFSDIESVSITNLDIADGTASGATVLTYTEQFVQDGQVFIDFDQAHEVAMLTFDKADSAMFMALEMIEAIAGRPLDNPLQWHAVEATPDSTVIEGDFGTDFVFGSDADEVLTGGAGRSSLLQDGLTANEGAQLGRAHGDFMFGGGGNDKLYGFAGNDLLDGGRGDDDLWGGSGFDTFVFNAGNDTVHDFDHRVDTLVIADHLVEGSSLQMWLAQNVQHDGNVASLQFDAENSLTIHGVDHVDDLFGVVGLYEDTDQFLF